jgi:hypothetical protein
MDIRAIDLAGAEIGAAYNLFLNSLLGRYLALRAPGMKVTPQLMEQFRSQARDLATTFLMLATRTIATQTPPDPVGSAVRAPSASETAFAALLSSSVALNIKQAAGWLQGGMPSAFTRPLTGAMGELLQRQMSNPQFKLPDAVGRHWDAYTLIKTAARDFFYQAAIDRTATAIATDGGLGKVRYDGDAHTYNGMILSVDGREGRYKTLDSVRSKIFHPNARAVLELYLHV